VDLTVPGQGPRAQLAMLVVETEGTIACGGGYVAQLAMPAPPPALFILL